MTPVSSLDPIFPLPADTGPPPIKEGEGRELFNRTDHVANGMTYRAFYVLWEQAEHRAREHYARYKNGHLPHVAETWLEVIVHLRQIGHPNIRIEPISEKKAKKIRAKEAEELKKKQESAAKARAAKGKNPVREGESGEPSECPKCGTHRTILPIQHKKTGLKLWKCADCDHRWPRTAPTSRSEALDGGGGSKAPGKKKPASQKRKKRAKKGS